MNRLVGHIINLEVEGSITLVTLALTGDMQMKTIVIDTPETASYLELDLEVNVLFKETEVVIGTQNTTELSLQNKLPCTVKDVEKGALLSSVVMDSPAGEIRSIISSQAVRDLRIVRGSKLVAMIKLNEVMLSPR